VWASAIKACVGGLFFYCLYSIAIDFCPVISVFFRNFHSYGWHALNREFAAS
jgi:hypothetical protein